MAAKRWQLRRSAFKYSFANRCIITDFVASSLNDIFKDKVKLMAIADVSHERIDCEDFGGNSYWVHRNGASRVAYNQSQPSIVPLPGFPGGPSFLCAASKGLRESFNSVNHGAGRVLNKSQAKNKFSQTEIIKAFREKNIKLYKLGNEDVSEQAPRAFKDINKIIDTLKEHDLVRPVLALRPLAVIKG